MKTVVLTSEAPSNVWLVNQLLSRHEIRGIVVERRPLALTARDKVERRRRMIRRYGIVRTLNKLLFNRVRSRFLAPSESRTAAVYSARFNRWTATLPGLGFAAAAASSADSSCETPCA